MNKLMTIAAFAGVFALADVEAAEARLFEPQTNWLHSGRACVSTRGPAALRWDVMPPRSCRGQEPEGQAQAPASATPISFAENLSAKTKTTAHQGIGRLVRRGFFLAGA